MPKPQIKPTLNTDKPNVPIMIPYARQSIDESDIEAVVDTLRGALITTGPLVDRFENAIREFTGTKHAVAVANGTAALHAAMSAANIQPGDEVIVPTLTFLASANCVVYQGGTPVFADVDPDTLLVDPADVERKITSKTKAVIAVDYAGQPCDYKRLRDVAAQHGLVLVADAAHSLGADLDGGHVGTLANLTTLSFHPVKHITTGEGGMVLCDDETTAQTIRRFRHHGIDADHHLRSEKGQWHYQMTELGYNYRVTDFQCALGLSQLKKLPNWLQRRREIAARYDEEFSNLPQVSPLKTNDRVNHAYHLYVVRVPAEDRKRLFSFLREKDVGVNVHYIPVHLQPFHQKRFGCSEGLCPNAERVYQTIISLPMFPGLRDDEFARVVALIKGFFT